MLAKRAKLQRDLVEVAIGTALARTEHLDEHDIIDLAAGAARDLAICARWALALADSEDGATGLPTKEYVAFQAFRRRVKKQEARHESHDQG